MEEIRFPICKEREETFKKLQRIGKEKMVKFLARLYKKGKLKYIDTFPAREIRLPFYREFKIDLNGIGFFDRPIKVEVWLDSIMQKVKESIDLKKEGREKFRKMVQNFLDIMKKEGITHPTLANLKRISLQEGIELPYGEMQALLDAIRKELELKTHKPVKEKVRKTFLQKLFRLLGRHKDGK